MGQSKLSNVECTALNFSMLLACVDAGSELW